MSFFNNKKEASSSVDTFTATANQTLFTLSGSYIVGQNQLQIFIGGVRQFSPTNFTESGSSTFTLSEGVSVGTAITAIY